MGMLIDARDADVTDRDVREIVRESEARRAGQEPGDRTPRGRSHRGHLPSGSDDTEEAPAIGNAFQLVFAGVFEREARARDEVFDRRRDEHVARLGEPGDARSDVDGDPADRIAVELHLARVDPGPDLDTERLHRVGDRLRAADGARGAVERRQEAVAGGIDLTPSVPFELDPGFRVMLGEQLAPPAVPEIERLAPSSRRCR